MPRAYYSAVLDQPAAQVWSVIRPFDHYAWAGVAAETVIENGKRADEPGAIRRVVANGHVLRQVLLAHSDADCAYSYAFVSEPPVKVWNYVATIRVVPVRKSGGAFIEWWADFDCADADRAALVVHFEGKGFAVWLDALRHFMARACHPAAAH